MDLKAEAMPKVSFVSEGSEASEPRRLSRLEALAASTDLVDIAAILPEAWLLWRTPGLTVYSLVGRFKQAAHQHLRTLLGERQKLSPGLERLAKEDSPPDILNSGNRRDILRTARYGAMAVLRAQGYSTPEVGEALRLSGSSKTFHHTTILPYSSAFLENLCQYRPSQDIAFEDVGFKNGASIAKVVEDLRKIDLSDTSRRSPVKEALITLTGVSLGDVKRDVFSDNPDVILAMQALAYAVPMAASMGAHNSQRASAQSNVISNYLSDRNLSIKAAVPEILS